MRRTLHRIIFGHETPGGKLFDVVLIVAILASVAAVMLESVEPIRTRHGLQLRFAEWVFTALFTLEYGVRLIAARSASRYARSFFGIVDLMAILPTYLSLLIPGGQAFAVIRVLRVLRVFRVLKLAQFVGTEQYLLRAMQASARKIVVFVIAVMSIVVVVGALMYFVEGPASGFTSIPVGVYWAIVTLTTVGFGDITPQTGLGQAVAALVMILGYGIIAVPTGIVTAEMVQSARRSSVSRPVCAGCGEREHDADAAFCKRCGSELVASP